MIAKIKPVLLPYLPDRLCKAEYPGHKKGCPNYCKKEGCPPGIIRLDELIDFDQCWVIWNKFDLFEHRKRMLRKHPEWSKRQAECCLYWQRVARRQLEKDIEYYILTNPDMKDKLLIFRCPEAHSVDVGATMRQIGIEIWPIVSWTYQVAIAGVKK